MSCTIAILYFLTIYGLETIGSSTVWRPALRGLLADYAYPVCPDFEGAWLPSHSLTSCYSSQPASGWDSHISLVRSRQQISLVFPSVGLFIQHSHEAGSFNSGTWTQNGSLQRSHSGFSSCCYSTMTTYVIPSKQFANGLLLTVHQNVSSLTAQARQFPLKKPAGFHWDFFLLGCTTFISGIIGIPFPNGLVPQV